MNPIQFYKMSGCGNDFIIIDNRSPVVEEKDLFAFIVGVCRRKMSVGADGIILIDTLYNYASEPEIVDGLTKLGLDPATVKYVIVSHGHGDHDGAGCA